MRGPWAGILDVRVGPAILRAAAHRLGAQVWAAETLYDGPADLTTALAHLAGECRIACRAVRVAVEHPPAQVRTLRDLPPVRDRDLAALVAHQGPRFFRRNGAALVTDAVWVRERGTRLARAAAVEAPLVDAITAGVRAAGLALTTIAVADCPLPLTLLPEAERGARARAARRRVGILSAVTIAIWLGVGGLWVARLFTARRAVDRELVRLQAPLAEVLAARRQVHDVEAAVWALRRAAKERPEALRFLARVTAALPDSAVLTSLSWQADGTPVLSGAARQAPAVLARLEQVPSPVAPAFAGPVVREPVGGRTWDRFTIEWRRASGRTGVRP